MKTFVQPTKPRNNSKSDDLGLNVYVYGFPHLPYISLQSPPFSRVLSSSLTSLVSSVQRRGQRPNGGGTLLNPGSTRLEFKEFSLSFKTKNVFYRIKIFQSSIISTKPRDVPGLCCVDNRSPDKTRCRSDEVHTRSRSRSGPMINFYVLESRVGPG